MIQTFKSVSAAGAVCLAFASAPGPAHAFKLPEGDFYLSLRGGIDFPDDQRNEGDVLLELELDRGWHIGGAVGYALAPVSYGRWRFELETMRINDDAETLLINGNDVPFEGDVMVNTLMVNTLLDFTTVSETIHPFIGFGIGGAQVYPEIEYGPFRFYDKDIAFGYQLMGGVTVRLTDRWSVQGDMRYFSAVDPQLPRETPFGDQSLDSEYSTILLTGAVTFTF